MKNSLLLSSTIFLLLWTNSIFAQNKRYVQDSTFQFELAKFDNLPLYQKAAIQGVVNDYLLVNTTLNNENYLVLVDTLGNVLDKFKGKFFFPQNWQTNEGFYFYEIAETGLYNNTIKILYYDILNRKLTKKEFSIKDFYYYSYFKPIISQNYFICTNTNSDIYLFDIQLGKNKIIQHTDIYQSIMSVFFDKVNKQIDVITLTQLDTTNKLNFYQFPLDQEANLVKHLKWSKFQKDFGIKRISLDSKIIFNSENAFHISSALFEDTTCVAILYNFAGSVISKFTVPLPSYQEIIDNWYSDYHISFFNDSWVLINPFGINTSILYQRAIEKRSLPIENYYLVGIPPITELNSHKSSFVLVSSDSTNAIRLFDTKTFSFKDIRLQIPKIQNTYIPAQLYTLNDGSYWVSYYSPNGSFVKYNNLNQEVYRTPDSLMFLPSNNEVYTFSDNSILISTYQLISNEYCQNCIPSVKQYLKIDANEKAQILSGDFLNGKRIYYCDTTHRHYYTLTNEKLERYSFDNQLDTTFSIPNHIEVGCMLVSKQGNIYLGQRRNQNIFTLDSLYKLQSNGKVEWCKKYLQSESNSYNQVEVGIFYGGAYPIYSKDSVIIWGYLACGEGCYTANNVAYTENNALVSLGYLKQLENNGPARSFIDKYGVFIKNNQTFLIYNVQNKSIDKDTNTIFYLPNQPYFEPFYSMDVLPNKDILVVNNSTIQKYVSNKLWTTIKNLEYQDKNYSDNWQFWEISNDKNSKIPLDVYTSDGSTATVKVLPENSLVAYIKNDTLFFTGISGEIQVYAQSVNGGTSYTSRFFHFTGALSIDNPSAYQITLFPNPINYSTCTVSSFKDIYTTQIIDILGKKQKISPSQSIKMSEFQLNTYQLDDFSSGIYTIQFFDQFDILLDTKRIIILK